MSAILRMLFFSVMLSLPDNLLEAFLAEEVDQTKFESLLGEHFHASMESSRSAIAYPTDPMKYALKLRYRGGVLVAAKVEVVSHPRYERYLRAL